MNVPDALLKKAANIRLVVTDIDGVWTDGGMYYSEHGDELKKFNTRDGMGVALLRQKGVQVAVVTGEHTEIVSRRADKLGLELVYQGIKDKKLILEELTHQLSLTPEEVAFIGDDINDLNALSNCGLSATVSDGMAAVKAVVDYVCRKAGGEGAFREFAELILLAKDGLQKPGEK